MKIKLKNILFISILCFFIFSCESIVEDLNDYNKVAELFENVMKTDQERENEDV